MSKKDVAFKIRIQSQLRQEFLDACEAEDRSAAQIIREYMREYVARYHKELQQPLLPETERPTTRTAQRKT